MRLCVHSGDARVTVSRLSYSHRLSAIVRHIISPIYAIDGITLRGRDPVPHHTPHTESLDDAFRAIWGTPEGLFLVLHDNTGCVKSNSVEVELVVKLLQAGEGLEAAAAGNVGIITPHNLQQAELLKRLHEQRGAGSEGGNDSNSSDNSNSSSSSSYGLLLK